MIFTDSNIPMYLIGADHPHKTEAQVLLERLIAAGQRLVTDAEVLHEILHRYTAIDKRFPTTSPLELTASPDSWRCQKALRCRWFDRPGQRPTGPFDAFWGH